MFLAMMAGMMVGAFLFATAIGTTVSEARREHAVAWVIVMAIDMTVPMVAVMLYRGHSRRSAGEMAAAMIVPALPIVACQLSHVVSDEIGRAYMPVSMLARSRSSSTGAASTARQPRATRSPYGWRGSGVRWRRSPRATILAILAAAAL
jgi:hypothetical protein